MNKNKFTSLFDVLPVIKSRISDFCLKNLSHLKVIAVLALLGTLLYSRSLNNPFVYDDRAFILNSNLINNLHNIGKLFSPYDYFEYGHDITYRPIPTLQYFVNYALWTSHPAGHRISSILSHVLNGVMLYFLVLLLLKENPGAGKIGFLAALIFIAHPLQSESVLEVTFNETLLVNLFYLCAFYAYVLYTDTSRTLKARRNLFVCSMLFYMLALFSKENAVTFPLMILLYDLCYGELTFEKGFLRRIKWERYLSFALVTAFFLAVRFSFFRHSIENIIGYPGGSYWTNMLTMLQVVPLYLRLILVPVNLSIEYKIGTAVSLIEPEVLLGLLLCVIFLLAAAVIFRRSRKNFFFYSWIFILLIPVSNIFPMQILAAERYLYSSMTGFSVLAAAAIWRYLPKKMPYLFTGLLLCFYCVVVFFRIGDWKDEFTFWKQAVYKVPYSDGAHNGLGWALMGRQKYDAAISEFKQSLSFKPDYFEAQNSLASAYYAKGDYETAIKEFNRALKMNPYMSTPHISLGKIYKMKEMYGRAIKEFKTALLLDSSKYDAHVHLGDIYQKTGDIYQAALSYDRAIRINPGFALPYNSLGIIFGDKGFYGRSAWYLQKAVNLEPGSCEMRLNLAYVYYLAGQNNLALKELNRLLEICPDHPKAKYLISQIKSKNG